METSSFEYNFLGRSGIKVSNICLGTSTFGSQTHAAWNQDHVKEPRPASDDETAVKLLDRFIEMGGNFLDMADTYSHGECEQIVGNWLSGKDRHKIVLASKVGTPMDDSNPNGRGLNRKNICHSIENSLHRLQTDFVDMYMIHYWDNATPLEESLRTFNDLVRCGKIKYFGVNNLMGYQLQKVIDYCKFMGFDPPINIQSEYSLLTRSLECEVFNVCREEGISLTPWGTLKGGWLTGKYKRNESLPKNSRITWSTNQHVNNWASPAWQQFEHNEECWKILDTVKTIAKQTGKTVSQISLRWCLQKDIIPAVIVGAKTLEQLEENVGAAKGWHLSEQQMTLLDEVSEWKFPPTYVANHLLDRKRTLCK